VPHARTESDLPLRLGPDGVRVAVRDSDSTAPRPSAGPVEGGRGLQLVAAAAARWGVLLGTTDKIVWADVAAASGPEAGVAWARGRSDRNGFTNAKDTSSSGTAAPRGPAPRQDPLLPE
jgi:hypothetical protein